MFINWAEFFASGASKYRVADWGGAKLEGRKTEPLATSRFTPPPGNESNCSGSIMGMGVRRMEWAHRDGTRNCVAESRLGDGSFLVKTRNLGRADYSKEIRECAGCWVVSSPDGPNSDARAPWRWAHTIEEAASIGDGPPF